MSKRWKYFSPTSEFNWWEKEFQQIDDEILELNLSIARQQMGTRTFTEEEVRKHVITKTDFGGFSRRTNCMLCGAGWDGEEYHLDGCLLAPEKVRNLEAEVEKLKKQLAEADSKAMFLQSVLRDVRDYLGKVK